MFPSEIKNQQGYLMPVAIFIILILGGLAITLSRFSGQSDTAVIQEAISVAAFNAAESGGQYAMNRLFYSAAASPTRTLVDANCTAINGVSLNFSAVGLGDCSANLTCSVSANLPTNTISYYTVTSAGQCGSGSISANRVIELASQLMGAP
jgi:MSHA biogenesis protein MshP